ncbi:hypothetical protein [Glutamicibacter sp.]|uniref:hypothetical protein n=1 Tax=Glutamicibacter sp. TaxID=1931995 RepID=UPI0028BE7D39|nr:hypothetical protein [Glutamicibacter sp.]
MVAIIEILAAHSRKGGIRDRRTHCICGWKSQDGELGGKYHLAHVGEVLERFTQWLEQEAKAAGYTEAADVLSSEARWQYEQDARRVTGAQIVAQRMGVMEQIMRDRAKELTNV